MRLTSCIPLRKRSITHAKQYRSSMRTICSLIRFPSSSIVRILLHTNQLEDRLGDRGSPYKSMPIVVMKEGVHESSQKRRRRHDLPTPESPIRSSLIRLWVKVSVTRLAFSSSQPSCLSQLLSIPPSPFLPLLPPGVHSARTRVANACRA